MTVRSLTSCQADSPYQANVRQTPCSGLQLVVFYQEGPCSLEIVVGKQADGSNYWSVASIGPV